MDAPVTSWDAQPQEVKSWDAVPDVKSWDAPAPALVDNHQGKKLALAGVGLLETLTAGMADLANIGGTAISRAIPAGLGAASITGGMSFTDAFKEEFNKTYTGIKSAIPYMPETDAGKLISSGVGELLSKAIPYVGDQWYNLPTLVGKEPSPFLGAAAQAAATLATLLAGGKAKDIKLPDGAPKLGGLKNTETSFHENWNDPKYVAQWADKNYPETMKNLQASAVGKVRPTGPQGAPAVDAYNKLHSVLKEQLQGQSVDGMSLTQKMHLYFDKLDPAGEVPLDARAKMVDSVIGQFDELNKLANSSLTPEQLVQARLVRPVQTIKEIIERQTGVKAPPTPAETTARTLDFKAALKERQGWVIGADSIERPMTAGEYLDIQNKAREAPKTAADIVAEQTIPQTQTLQAIVEHLTGQKIKSGVTEADVKAALNEKSGIWSADGEGQIEKQLTIGEYYKLIQDGKAQVPKVVQGILDQQAAGKLSSAQTVQQLSQVASSSRFSPEAQAAAVEAGRNVLGKPGGKQSGMIYNDSYEALQNNAKAIRDLSDKSKNITAAGLLTNQRFNELDSALTQGRLHQGFNITKDGITTRLFDTTGPVKRSLEESNALGVQAKQRFNLVRGAHARALEIFKESWRGLAKGQDAETLRNAESIVAARTIVAIDQRKGLGKVKHVLNTNGAEMDAFSTTLKSRIGAEAFDKANKVADKVFRTYQDQLRARHENNILTDASYLAMHNIEYSPTEYLAKLDPERQFTFHGKTITVRDSGIPTIGRGDTGAIRVDMKSQLAETVLRTQTLILKNDANRALRAFAEHTPENDFVKSVPVKEWDEFGVAKKVPAAPPGFTRIDSLIKGQQHPMFLRDDFAEQWIVRKSEISAEFGNQLRFWTGTSILKTLATTFNPAFPFVSFPRDLGLIWAVNDAAYSAQLPIYALQMGKDLVKVLPDTLLRKGRWKDFAKDGGMQEMMSQQGPSAVAFGGNPVVKMTNAVARNITEALGFLGTFFESWPRIALRDRLMQNGKTSWEASAGAREYLDFTEGGSYVKALDSMSPYFSAGVQGTYTLGKAIRRDPKTMAWKAAQFMGVSGSAILALEKINPEARKDISEHDLVNNFVIAPKGMFQIDPYGNKRHYYFIIPIEQDLVPLHAGMLALVDKVVQGKNPSLSLLKEVNNGANPFANFSLPLYDAYNTYRSNYSMWKDDQIWKGAKVNPEDEIIAGFKANATPEWLNRVGKETGLSPERMRAAIASIAPANPYTNIMGAGMQQWLEGATDYDKSNATMEIVKKLGLGRFVKLTHPFTSEVAALEAAERDHNSKRGKQLDALGSFIFRGANKQGDASKEFAAWLPTQSPEDQDQLVKQFVSRYAVDQVFRQLKASDGIPSRTWWTATMQAAGEVRADVFYQEWVGRPQAGRDQMIRVSKAMSQFGQQYWTQPFDREFASEVNKYGSNPR